MQCQIKEKPYTGLVDPRELAATAASLMVIAWPSVSILKFMDARKEKQREKRQDNLEE
jgi:hypothetical protein